MKQSVIFSALGSAAMTYAHGIVSDMTIGGVNVGGYNPVQDPYMNPAPERIVWAFPDAGNGPVEDVSSADIVCNKGATPAKTSQTVAAGSDVTFMWTVWPESHKGPAMTYMAACPGADCSTADPTTLDFFKIHDAGLNADGSWASDDLIANNNSLTVTLPSDIKPGAYLLRHELLALHSAGNANGAQFYPMCANLVVEGSGTAEPAGVKFPGAYKADDAGILVSIYNGLTSYTIPGPAVYGSSGSSPAEPSTPAGNSTAPAPTSAAPDASAPAATSLAPEPVATEPVASEPAASAPAATSSAPEAPSSAPSSAPASGPTTMQTVTRPAATGTATNPIGTAPPSYGGAPSGSAPSVPAPSGSAPGGYDKTPEGINKCLDEVNRCIARAQSQKGNGFSKCESQRASCY